MKIISFMNMKGGVGKTTLAVNVAYAIAEIGKKNVLIVDCDPQFNATQYLVTDDAYLAHIQNSTKGTIKEIFVPHQSGPINTIKGLSKPINREKMALSDCTMSIYKNVYGKGKLDLMPSTLDLVQVQNSPRQTETKLKNYLKEKAVNYDYVIIDCPPTISIFTEAAILASDSYLVPIKPDPLSILGLPLLERYIDDYTADAGIKIQQIGLVFTLVRSKSPPKTMREVMQEIRKQRGKAVFEARTTEAQAVADSVTHHKPVFRYNKATQNVRMQYVDVAIELLKRVGDPI